MEIDFPSVGQLLAAVPVLGLVLALLNVWMSSRNERRRSQPVVIVHKRGDLVFAEQVERWVAQCVLKNEGGGPVRLDVLPERPPRRPQGQGRPGPPVQS